MPVIFAAKAVGTGGGGVAWVMRMARGGCQMPINRRANGVQGGVRRCKRLCERTHSDHSGGRGDTIALGEHEMAWLKINRRNRWLLIEMLVLFGTPFVVFSVKSHGGLLFGLLFVALLYAVVWLMRQKIDWRQEWAGRWMTPATMPVTMPTTTRAARRRIVRGIGLRLMLVVVASAALTQLLVPERFLSFPRLATVQWMAVMTLYPLLSALPQEVIFRSFFFRRYQSLFPTNVAMLVANSLAFGVTHLIFHNWVAPTLSVVAGVMLARSYQQHRSLGLVWAEHALYGCIAFTTGLGWFFYHGSNGG